MGLQQSPCPESIPQKDTLHPIEMSNFYSIGTPHNLTETNDQWHDNGLIWWCWCSLGFDPGDLTLTLSADSQ